MKDLTNCYLSALSCLAAGFRSANRCGDLETAKKTVVAYNVILDLLLSSGWFEGIDIDPESLLPCDLVLERLMPDERNAAISQALNQVLLREKLKWYDAVIMTVLKVQAQQIVGEVECVYSRRFEGQPKYGDGQLSFFSAPGSWGNTTLKVGERALVFLTFHPGARHYYQACWNGHFTLIDIEGVQHAIANWHLLSLGPIWQPAYLAEAAFLPDPSAPKKVAMPYRLLERHLLEELALLDSKD